jgi:hypothetical protein
MRVIHYEGRTWLGLSLRRRIGVVWRWKEEPGKPDIDRISDDRLLRAIESIEMFVEFGIELGFAILDARQAREPRSPPARIYD